MRLEQLPNGTYATTPIYVGHDRDPRQCAEHAWETKARKPLPDGDDPPGMRWKHFQACPQCGWSRVLLTPNGDQ